ncbi:MAG: T9SS type A sorting domain-containing protein [Prevotellaceae bacterium]|jgi:hypothetical protein|nr:T9SS type A sorting domain-containing protein [Prevotellaceae bacterium]
MKKKLLVFSVLLLSVSLCASTAVPHKQPDMLKFHKSEQLSKQQRTPQAGAEDVVWTEITSPFQADLIFDPEHAISGGQYEAIFVAYKITLIQDCVLSFGSDNGIPAFDIYRDAQMQEWAGYAYSAAVAMPAGTYYIRVNDGYTYANSEGETALEAKIAIETPPVTAITLSYDQTLTLTNSNTSTYYPEMKKMQLYEFQASELQLIQCIVDPTNDLQVILMSIENGSTHIANSVYPVGTGKYFLAVIDANNALETESSVTATLKIEPSTATVTPVTLNYQGYYSLTTDNAVTMLQAPTMFYSFTVEKERPLYLSFPLATAEDPLAIMCIFDEKGKRIADNMYSFSEILTDRMPVGKYFMSLSDAFGWMNEHNGEMNGHFSLELLKTYDDLDYSTALKPDSVYLCIGTEMEYAVVQRGAHALPVATFHFDAQQGHRYLVSWKGFSDKQEAVWQTGIGFFGDPLTGIYETDNLAGTSGLYYNTSTGEGATVYICNEDKRINLIMLDVISDGNITFTVKMEDLTQTHADNPADGEFEWADITLPFRSLVHFDMDYANSTINKLGDILKHYRLTLTEPTRVTYVSGLNPATYGEPYMSVYRDEAMTDKVKNLKWSDGSLVQGSSIDLEAGTYYIVFTDNGYNTYMPQPLTCYLIVEGTTDFESLTLITLPQLLDAFYPDNNTGDACIADYSTLPYQDAGYFIEGISTLVKGEAGLFMYGDNDYSYNYFARAYKLAGMYAGDVANISNHHSGDAYLYVYKKDENGTYAPVAQNDNSAPGVYDSYISFTAPETDDYFVVATTSNSFDYTNNSSFAVNIWKGAEQDEPVSKNPAEANEVLIVSTAASATEIVFPENVTYEEILAALLALEVTATNADGTIIELENNPYFWTISDYEARLTNLIEPYVIGEGYTAAVVLLKTPTAVDKADAGSEAYRLGNNAAAGIVTVFGLKGSEQLTVISTNGQIVARIPATADTLNIPTANLPKGAYIVAIQAKSRLTALKFVK